MCFQSTSFVTKRLTTKRLCSEFDWRILEARLGQFARTTDGQWQLQWATKVTLGSKIRFWSAVATFSPLPPQTMLIFLFFGQHRLQRLHNIELGSQGYQRRNARCE